MEEYNMNPSEPVQEDSLQNNCEDISAESDTAEEISEYFSEEAGQEEPDEENVITEETEEEPETQKPAVKKNRISELGIPLIEVLLIAFGVMFLGILEAIVGTLAEVMTLRILAKRFPRKKWVLVAAMIAGIIAAFAVYIARRIFFTNMGMLQN